jgi:hypothetical protein
MAREKFELEKFRRRTWASEQAIRNRRQARREQKQQLDAGPVAAAALPAPPATPYYAPAPLQLQLPLPEALAAAVAALPPAVHIPPAGSPTSRLASGAPPTPTAT